MPLMMRKQRYREITFLLWSHSLSHSVHTRSNGTFHKDTEQLRICIIKCGGLSLGARLPRWLSGKESKCQHRRRRFDPWIGKIPRRWEWQPVPICLPGKPHGQRSPVGTVSRVAKSRT